MVPRVKTILQWNSCGAKTYSVSSISLRQVVVKVLDMENGKTEKEVDVSGNFEN